MSENPVHDVFRGYIFTEEPPKKKKHWRQGINNDALVRTVLTDE
jgi:hypothetical protein